MKKISAQEVIEDNKECTPYVRLWRAVILRMIIDSAEDKDLARINANEARTKRFQAICMMAQVNEEETSKLLISMDKDEIIRREIYGKTRYFKSKEHLFGKVVSRKW